MAAQAVARAVYEDFLHRFWRLDPRAVGAAEALLRELLASPALESLAAREAFERLVIEALNARGMRRRGGLLFFAALAAFRWSETPPLPPPGMARDTEWQLHRWIDAALILNANKIQTWLWLAEEPRLELFGHIPMDRNFDWNNAVREICCQPGELGHWHQLSEVSPLGPITPLTDPAPKRGTRWHEWLRWLKTPEFLMLVLPMALLIFVVVPFLHRNESADTARHNATCAQRLEAAAAVKWQGFSIAEIDKLRSCAAEVAPPRCEDRRGLKRLIAITDVLTESQNGAPSSAGFAYRSDEIVIDPPTGPPISIKTSVCGTAFQMLVEGGGWLRLGDLPTAQAVVRQAGYCNARAVRHMRGDGTAKELVELEWLTENWSVKLLSRTAEWREGQRSLGDNAPVTPGKPTVDLASLVSTDPKLAAGGVPERWEAATPCQVEAR